MARKTVYYEAGPEVGLVPVKVIRKTAPGFDRHSEVKVTRSKPSPQRPVYQAGEIIRVLRRKLVHKAGVRGGRVWVREIYPSPTLKKSIKQYRTRSR